MIKTKPPRPKSSKGGDGGGDAAGGASSDKSHKNSGGPSSSSAAAAKKRRPSQKKKDASDGIDDSKRRSIGGMPSSSAAALHLEEHRRYYQRAPRLLPDIDGVQALSSSEIQSDLKHLQSSLSSFESKMAALLPPGATNPLTAGGGVYLHPNKEGLNFSMEDPHGGAGGGGGSFMFQKRRSRPNGVITPEELVESLPLCRRAVRITQRELAAMKRERDDLERDFMRQRNKLLWQMGEMKRIQRQQDKVLRVLSQDVVTKAKSLESSRRRTNAMQDIMTELDARGSAVLRLTREKHQLETLLKKHALELPEPDEVYLGDRVTSQFGTGHVVAMDDVQRLVTVDLESGGTAYVREEFIEVLPCEVSYAETEKQLKHKLFEKIGALVQPNGKLSLLALTGGGRRRSRADMADDSEDDLALDAADHSDSDDDADENDAEDDADAENGGDADDTRNSRRSATDRDLAEDKRTTKKRKLMVHATASSAASAKKKQKQQGKVFDFTAGKIPITPYDVGLLLSPLSVLPERVAAVGPDALQWLSSYLPTKMAEWENDRYESLQMQGEIERLRFQLQKAEAEKEDAHELAVEQVDSMNELVRQIEKLREQVGSKDTKDKDAHSSCPNCSSSSGSSGKKTTTTANAGKATKSNGKTSAGNKASHRRQRTESMDVDEEDGTDKKDRGRDDSDAPEDSDTRKEDATHDDDEFADDGGESSDASKPAARSLRPRRGSNPTTASATSSSKSSK